MRVVVDLTLCQGYAQCAFLAPESFKLSGEEALMYDPGPDDAQRERIMRAAAACPVRAIFTEPGPQAADAVTAGPIAIVGAGLAGLRAAETLRREGYEGKLTVIGDEDHQPYDRPPLSKQVLTGWVAVGPHHAAAPSRTSTTSTGGSGAAAVGLDLAEKQVALDDGRDVPYDRC